MKIKNALNNDHIYRSKITFTGIELQIIMKWTTPL